MRFSARNSHVSSGPGCSSIWALVIFVSLSIDVAESSSAMKRLYEDLFTDYNRLILPVANNRTKVTVTLGLKLGQILDLNLKQQILSTNVWVEQTWHDYKLQWEPDSYEGIGMIHVPAENIWIPDIVLFNNADGNYELTLVAKARVYSNGTVVWKPPTMFRSTCEIDVQHFPFDIQTCFLRFGSWTYAGDELELRHQGTKDRRADIGIDLSQFYKNVEWDIIDVPAYYNENHYDCCEEIFPDITFQIVIRRKMLFYLVNLILPVALMTFMTVSVFYLPSDSNEKVTLSISILTSLIVFFLLMLEIIPASSLAVPLFGKYLLFTLVLVSLSACLSVYVLNIHHRSPAVHSMSPRMRRIFLETLPRLLHLNRPDINERSSLNRFRKKKLAQQLLNNSVSGNKVYDLTLPMAASLNLIETLHKSYKFNPADDDEGANPIGPDDEGRYFRRYVDNYIAKLKQRQTSVQPAISGQLYRGCNCVHGETTGCCDHNRCCSHANQPLVGLRRKQQTNGCCCSTFGDNTNNNSINVNQTVDWTDGSADMMCPLVRPSKAMNLNRLSQSPYLWNQSLGLSDCKINSSQHKARASATKLGMLNDDTLDMTFDCDYDMDNIDNPPLAMGPNGRLSGQIIRRQASATKSDCAADEELPSPPPPPKQVTRLQGPLLGKTSGRLSSCSKNLMSNSSEESSDIPAGGQSHLVDKLINSINFINDASDDMESSTTSNEKFPLRSGYAIQSDQIGGLKMSHMDEISHMHLPPVGENLSFRDSSCEHQAPTLRRQVSSSNPNGLVCGSHAYDCRQDEQQQAPDAWQANQENRIKTGRPSELLMSLGLPYDQMPAHVRSAIRSILFIADTIKNEDDENSATEDWESMSMVIDRLFLWIFLLLCTIGSVIILALAPSLYDQRASIDDQLRLEIPLNNCSASFAD